MSISSARSHESTDPQRVIEDLSEWPSVLESETPNDLRLIQQTKMEQEQLMQVCENKEAQLKEIIRATNDEVETLKEQAKGPDEKNLQSKHSELLAFKEEVQERVASLKRDIEDMEKRKADASTLVAQRLIETQLEKTNLDKKVKVLESTLKLYTNVSQIVWDSDGKRDEIKGTVHLMKTKAVKPFVYAVPTTAKARVELADKLWDLMWLDHQ